MYIMVDLGACRVAGHRFETFGSLKTPMKLNLRCVNCSRGQFTAIVASGDTTMQPNFGMWRRQRDQEEKST